MARPVYEQDVAAIAYEPAESAVMPWVMGAELLPGWVSETESEMHRLKRLTEDLGQRVLDLEQRLEIVTRCFDSIASRDERKR